MDKIRIAYLIDTISCNTAGTQKQLIEIIKRLNRQSFEPFLICLRKSAWMEKNELPCPVFTLNYTGFIKLSFYKSLKRFITIQRLYCFNILQTFFEDSLFMGFLGSKLSLTKPVLLSSRRDIGLDWGPSWFFRFYHNLYRLVLPMVNLGFDGIVANCESIKKYIHIKEKTPVKKIKVIYNGIDIIKQLEPEPSIFKEKDADIWIGIIANLVPVKRIDIFLKALAIFRDKREEIDFRALILGDGPEREPLLKICARSGLCKTVHFMGAVNNVYAYLQRMDIAVLCSDKEGFSNAILEYMACSLPVIATSVGGNKELVDETNGFCVPAGDYKALADALIILSSDKELREKMGKNSFERVKSTYSWDRSIKESENYYKELLRQRLCCHL